MQVTIAWVKVQHFQNPELSNSSLKTCSIPTKYPQFKVQMVEWTGRIPVLWILITISSLMCLLLIKTFSIIIYPQMLVCIQHGSSFE